MNRLQKNEPKTNGHAGAPRCGKKERTKGDATVSKNGDHAASLASIADADHPESPLTPPLPGAPGYGRGRKPATENFSSVCPESANPEEKVASASGEQPGNFSSVCPESANSEEKLETPAAEKTSRKSERGRPPVLDDYARGKLVISMAVGLSQRQAAGWLGCDQKTVSQVLNSDPRLMSDLGWHAAVARLHPFLKIYNEAAGNWKASAWLLEYLERRHGRLTVDDLMKMLMELWGLAREHQLPPEIQLDLAHCMKEDWQAG